MISIDMVFRIRFTAINTAESTINEPKLDAMEILQFETAMLLKTPPIAEAPNKSVATPKLAPELIPRTKGPANGFRKSVCINKPLMPSPEPTKIAEIDLGILKCNTI